MNESITLHGTDTAAGNPARPGFGNGNAGK